MRCESGIRFGGSCDRVGAYHTVTMNLIKPFRFAWQKLSQNPAISAHIRFIITGS